MIAGSIALGLLAMVSYGLANAFSLPLARRLGAARLLWLRGLVICAVLAVVALPVLGRLTNWRAALVAFAIGVLGYLPPLAFTHGIKISGVSLMSAVASTAPLVTVVLSVFFLGAHLQGMQWVGIGAVIAANVAVSINFRSLRNSNILKLASGVPYALIAALLWGLVFFLIIYPTRTLGPILSALMLEMGVLVAAGIHVAVRRESFLLRQAVTRPVIVNGLMILAGTLAYTIGVNSFNIGLVAALSNSCAAVSIVAANILHHEHLTPNEKILSAVMIAGLVLISVA